MSATYSGAYNAELPLGEGVERESVGEVQLSIRGSGESQQLDVAERRAEWIPPAHARERERSADIPGSPPSVPYTTRGVSRATQLPAAPASVSQPTSSGTDKPSTSRDTRRGVDNPRPARTEAGQLGLASDSGAAAAGRGVETEVFNLQKNASGPIKRFTPTGRRFGSAKPFLTDCSVGKFGVLSTSEADELERKLFTSFENDGLNLTGKSETVQQGFLQTLYLFLAINGGSIGNATGRLGVRDDSEPLCFMNMSVSAADVAAILGDRAYAFMRERATQIRDTVESAIATSRLADAETVYPGVCRAVDLIKVVAASKGLSQIPQYVAVGSQYAVGATPYIISAINESSAKVLSGSANIRDSNVFSSG